VLGNAVAQYKPDLVVVACNTASTLALAELRGRFAVPFVGTVPAIKPACAQSKSKRVAVLGTQATVDREYTRALIREFASGCDVHLVGSSNLAGFAEAELAGKPAADIAIKQEIGGCFVESDGRRTDTIVLACTHYPLLLDRFRVGAPWPVTWLDPASAIARRVADLMRDRKPGEPPSAPQIAFTSRRNPSPRLGAALAGYGF
jgi:glutamate racemase